MNDRPLQDIWQDVLKIIEGEISAPVSFKTWFLPMVPESLSQDELVLSVPNRMIKDIIDQKYADLLTNAVQHVVHKDVSVRLHVGEPPAEPIEKPKKNKAGESKKAQKSAQEPEENFHLNGSYLNPKYTFDSFVIGNSNRFAHAACLAVADSPNETYNPLFIYGGVGLGKTHLMHAIGHQILEQNKSAKVVYVSSEKFMNELIHSIQNNTNESFRRKYRDNVDIIMIDDIQFIAGKDSTQQELFHTFNELKDSNKQIILSSDRPPNEIPTLEDRLRTRFASGLLADIQSPDFETRVAILKKKAEAEGIVVSDDILVYIATKIKSNIRELEGAFIRVLAYARLTNDEITVELAAEALKDIVSDSQSRELSVELIQEVVANYYNITVEDLKSQRRTRNIALPRQIAMYLSRSLTGNSLPKIGEEFNKDHTTVIHAYTKISEAMEADKDMKTTIDNITKKLNS